jgi:putative heme-binding domain-containing protein
MILETASTQPDASDVIQLRRALAIGDVDSEAAGEILAKLALEHSDDRYFVAGAMSSLVPHVETVARAAADADREKRAPLLPYLFETAVALKKTEAIAVLLKGQDYDLADRFETYSALLKVLDRRRISLALFREDHPLLTSALDSLGKLSIEARKRAADPTAELADRLAAFSFLGRTKDNQKADQEILLSSLSTQTPIEIQRAAIRRLAEMGHADPLFALWSQTTPAVHQAIVTECLSKSFLTEKLLAALEDETISARTIDAAGRDRLIRYPNSKIRDRAKAVFGAESNGDRKAVVEEYAVALKLEGNQDRGLLVFQTACAICHQLEGVGREIGANLSALADKTGPSLLTAILDPNSAVEDKFLLYEVKLQGGETLAGMIGSESGDSLTLQLLDGSERQVLRGQVASITSTGRSAMPEGLEAALTPQQIADLIVFIQGATRSDP